MDSWTQIVVGDRHQRKNYIASVGDADSEADLRLIEVFCEAAVTDN